MVLTKSQFFFKSKISKTPIICEVLLPLFFEHQKQGWAAQIPKRATFKSLREALCLKNEICVNFKFSEKTFALRN